MSNFILICNNRMISSFQDYPFTYCSPLPTVIIVHHLKLFLFRNIYFGHVPPILFNFLLFSSSSCHVQYTLIIEYALCIFIFIFYTYGTVSFDVIFCVMLHIYFYIYWIIRSPFFLVI